MERVSTWTFSPTMKLPYPSSKSLGSVETWKRRKHNPFKYTPNIVNYPTNSSSEILSTREAPFLIAKNCPLLRNEVCDFTYFAPMCNSCHFNYSSTSLKTNHFPLEVRNPKRCGDTLILTQWNIWGLGNFSKSNAVNSINCDLLCLQEIGHPNYGTLMNIHKPVHNIQERKAKDRGGGTLTLTNLPVTSKRSFNVNKDSNLWRIVLDNLFVVWICNVYLNYGKTSQLQRLFNSIELHIPVAERPNVIFIGDFNINLEDPKSPKVVILKQLCKQYSFQIFEPPLPTRRISNSKIDFVIAGNGISINFKDQHYSLSDHDILYWEIKLNTTRKSSPILIPNKNLANKITKACVMNPNISNSPDLIRSFLNIRSQIKEDRAFVKVKRKKYDMDVFKNILLNIREDKDILKEINLYWEGVWQNIEDKRFSASSREAFDSLRNICKHHLFDKKDGGIVSCILNEDGKVLNDPSEVSSSLINTLKKVQTNPLYKCYDKPLPFPELPKLERFEVQDILKNISLGKALSFDLFADEAIRLPNILDKLSDTLKDLWSKALNDINQIEELFKARLLALNKVHPKIPHEEEFRPIIIMSVLVKIMEARWLSKLKKFMVSELCPSQTGFVPGQGTLSNIYRAVRRIRQRTNLKKHVFGLFIDYKSAYNHVCHEKLFQRLKRILNDDEIAFQKAIYSRIKIQSGSNSFSPNCGVAQGSLVSPAFFNVYTEPLYWELNKIFPLDDIYGYADDLLILCDSLSDLEKGIDIIDRWSSENDLIINKSKSAILEFVNRSCKKTYLKTNDSYAGFPVVNQYKYLGSWLNQKLTLDAQISHMKKKFNFIRSRLSPAL